MSRQEREEFSESLYDMLTQGGKLRSLEEVRQKDILRLLAADEKNKGIVSEVLRRLVTDVRDEVLRSAEAGLKGTAETLKETAGRRWRSGSKEDGVWTAFPPAAGTKTAIWFARA